jgi:ankyrin repeat protein
MLAAAGGHTEVMKMLMDKKCKLDVQDTYGNNLAIISVIYNKPDVLKFIIDNIQSQDVDILHRNKSGETCHTIAHDKKLTDIMRHLESASAANDDSRNIADQLMAEEEQHRQKEEQKKLKKKEKKTNAKISKKAQKEGLTADELKEKFKQDEEERIRLEAEREHDKEMREERERVEMEQK